MKDLNKENIFNNEISFPSQMDICFSEKCNLDCDYCFVNKTSEEELDYETIEKAINTFYELPGNDKTITFTTSEPFIYPDLFISAVNYIFKQAEKKGINISVVATTNGVAFDKKMQDFVSKMDERFTINFSLDGDAKSHNAHRKTKTKGAKNSFDLAWDNFRSFSLNKERKCSMRVISTISPSEVEFLEDNVDFMIGNNFPYIDLFPQMLTLWSEDDIKKLKKGLADVIEKYNENNAINFRLLNRLWGSSHYAKILLGADGNFYFFEWVLPLKEVDRKGFIIGNAGKIDLKKRKKLFELLFLKFIKAVSDKCRKCEHGHICANPLPLYLWSVYNGKKFSEHFENFCKIADVMIVSSKAIKNKNKLDDKKCQKNKGCKTC